jgi:hypothetical protein
MVITETFHGTQYSPLNPWYRVYWNLVLLSRTSIILMFLLMACAIGSFNLPLSCPYQWSDPSMSSIDDWSSCELKHIRQNSLKSSSQMNLNICKNQFKSPSQIILQRLASLSQSQFGSPGSAGKNSACAGSVTSGEANLACFWRANLSLLGQRGKTRAKNRGNKARNPNTFFSFVSRRRGEVS